MGRSWRGRVVAVVAMCLLGVGLAALPLSVQPAWADEGSATITSAVFNNEGAMLTVTAVPPAGGVVDDILAFSACYGQYGELGAFGPAGHISPGLSQQVGGSCGDPNLTEYYVQVAGHITTGCDCAVWGVDSPAVALTPALLAPTVQSATLDDTGVTVSVSPPPLPALATRGVTSCTRGSMEWPDRRPGSSPKMVRALGPCCTYRDVGARIPATARTPRPRSSATPARVTTCGSHPSPRLQSPQRRR